MPNQKLRPQVSLSLLASFEEHSLGIEQIETIFELTDSSQCDDLDIKFVLDMVSLSFEAAVSVTSELFDLAIISIDWENIDLYANDNYNMQKLCSIIICLIQNLGKYDEDDPKDALDYVFVDPDALCRKFVDECLAKIPGYHYVLKNLKYIKSLGGDTEKLADMFEQANYALPCNYQCDYIDKIAIYGKERADNYEIQQNEIITINKQWSPNKTNQTNNIEIKPVPTQSNEGKKRTSSSKVTGAEILALIIAIACIVTGSIVSCHYIYLGLIVSCILLFFASRSRKSKSPYENLRSGKITVPITDPIIAQQDRNQIHGNFDPNLINNKNNDEIEISEG